MATEIKVPSLGESVTAATVARWLKQPGEAVARDEPIAELETDKATLEIPAPAAGVLSEILVPPGAEVPVGAVLGRIAESEAQARPQTPPPPPPSPPGGRITKADVIAALARSAPQPEPSQAGAAPMLAPEEPPAPRAGRDDEVRVRMTRLRRRIAERLKAAQNTAAMLTTFNEIDMSEAIALRERWRAPFEQKHGVRLGFMSLFVKATIIALKELPALNAEIDGEDIVYKNHYDIGVAVGSGEGLVVPVLHDADRLSFAEIERKIAEFARKARDGKLSPAELSGGTFTISNGGVYGALMSTPILNPPQSGILGMHKIERRPVAIGDRVEIRPMMYVALSYDHRIVDGREAVTFLVRVKECVEDPARMLFDI